MKKLLLLFLATIPLIGCFEANDESGVKNSFCKDVPLERYQQVIGFDAKLRGISRDSAAVSLREGAKANKLTCAEVIDDSEAAMLLLGILLIGAIAE